VYTEPCVPTRDLKVLAVVAALASLSEAVAAVLAAELQPGQGKSAWLAVAFNTFRGFGAVMRPSQQPTNNIKVIITIKHT